MKWNSIEKLKNITYIQKVEERLEIKFPFPFLDLVKEHNYGSAFPDTFDTDKLKGKAFGRLLNFNLDEEYNILSEFEMIKDKLPPNVIPFSGDAGGNYLCFDYRLNKTNPPIFYWNHEQKFEIENDEMVEPDYNNEYERYNLDFVSNSLPELFEILYAEDDSDIDLSQMETIWEDFLDDEELKVLNDEDLLAVNKRRALKGLPAIKKEE